MTTAGLPPDPCPASPPDPPRHPDDNTPAPTSRRPTEIWDRHGALIYSMAMALLGDPVVAEQAVRLGLADLVSMEGPSTAEEDHRSWARLVYVRSQERVRGRLVEATAAVPSTSWFPPLAQLQRACVALCLFGGHTYREAAHLLDVPPTTVADLLTSGLRDAQRWSGGATNAIA